MGCGCGSGSSSTPAAAGAAQAASTSGAAAYEWEVTYTDGTTDMFPTEPEALAALSHSGGGLRPVPISR